MSLFKTGALHLWINLFVLSCDAVSCKLSSKAWEHVAPGLGTNALLCTDGLPSEKSHRNKENKRGSFVSVVKTLVNEMNKILGNVCLQTFLIISKANVIRLYGRQVVCVCAWGEFVLGSIRLNFQEKGRRWMQCHYSDRADALPWEERRTEETGNTRVKPQSHSGAHVCDWHNVNAIQAGKLVVMSIARRFWCFHN